MSIKFKTAEKINHPVLMEACLRKTPKGYRPIKQLIRQTIQDGIRLVKRETGIKDIIAIPGHYELAFTRKARYLRWYNYGCLVFTRGESSRES